MLKRDFDRYRGAAETHPFLAGAGYGHPVPFAHPDFEMWTQSLHFGAEGRMNTVHEETNLKIGGGLDDVWLNGNRSDPYSGLQEHFPEVPGRHHPRLDPLKAAYKRQMDLYVWVMRTKGFDVSDTGYFLYCDGDRFSEYDLQGQTDARMRFEMSLISYEVDQSWIEPTCLRSELSGTR